MFRNYLVSTLRNFWRHKFHTLINILGLAIGLTCCIFILLYIKDDLSYDNRQVMHVCGHVCKGITLLAVDMALKTDDFDFELPAELIAAGFP